MLLCSEILQSMRQFDNADKIFQGITTRLLNLIQCGHIVIYQLDRFTDNSNGMSLSGKILSEAIAPNCEPCSQEQIENILREEYQWGQDITEQIIHFYTTGVSRCEINLAEMFAGKAYLLVPIVFLRCVFSLEETMFKFSKSNIKKVSLVNSAEVDFILEKRKKGNFYFILF